MTWWHLAHYALWDRWDLADKALGCYRRFTPAARQLATQLGYKGLKWQKSVGPKGRSAPWVGNQVLLWKQPHPISLSTRIPRRLFCAMTQLDLSRRSFLRGSIALAGATPLVAGLLCAIE